MPEGSDDAPDEYRDVGGEADRTVTETLVSGVRARAVAAHAAATDGDAVSDDVVDAAGSTADYATVLYAAAGDPADEAFERRGRAAREFVRKATLHARDAAVRDEGVEAVLERVDDLAADLPTVEHGTVETIRALDVTEFAERAAAVEALDVEPERDGRGER